MQLIYDLSRNTKTLALISSELVKTLHFLVQQEIDDQFYVFMLMYVAYRISLPKLISIDEDFKTLLKKWL